MLEHIKASALFLIYIVWVFVFFASLFTRVRYGLFFLVPLIPLQNVLVKMQTLPLGRDLNDILILGMLFGWFITCVAKKKPVFGRSAFNILLILYIVFTYLNLWRGSNYLGFPAPLSFADTRLQTWKNYVVLQLLFFLSLNNLERKSELKFMITLMCASMLLMCFYTMRQISWMTDWTSRAKIEGTFVWLGANEVAAFFATYTFVLFGLFIFTKAKREKLFFAPLIWLNLYCDLFLFSRGAYLATLMGFFTISVIKVRKLLIPLIVLVVLWQAVLPRSVVDRIVFTEKSEGELDQSAQDRLVLWNQSLEFFKYNPLIGAGFNVFHHLGLRRDAHNIFLRTLAEQGLIGFSFLLILFLIAIRRSWRLYRRSEDPFFKGLGLGFIACVVAVIVGNIFGDRWTYLPLSAYFWVFLAMVERGNLITDAAKQKD